ncbi:response regulator [Zhihengliuella sp.]|uniref:response regulator n=1 Tax=Zhihengliuella sp. TaxID=1954483 RepID=UPI00281215CF|nr:response regulator [Zhihengliuella sp.]
MSRVLIVDDDFMVARVHAGFVAGTPGFEVVGTAHTGADALTAVRRLLPDLVLLDIYLPDVFGLDLLPRIREISDATDVIVVSAAREADTVRRAMRGGIVHYLIKPFKATDLRDKLEHYRRVSGSLSAGRTTAQSDLDRLFGAGAGPSRPPKGYSRETLDLVESFLAEVDGDVSAAETAEALGAARVTIRRYLEFLVESGRARVNLKYGTIGRPERRYELSD